MKHLVVAGCRLEFVDYPAHKAGFPVILMLHEGLGCVSMWRDCPAQLATATGCRVVVWSRPGYGGSQPYPEERKKDYKPQGMLMLSALSNAEYTPCRSFEV